ncbi:DUF1877 domain-containing protein [Streptomyces varsoviensis]|uniref:DUF1877 domain-containing protein n=1 Tax=Streptomyces varsoviensis TaxID=67373 RepID=UPI0033E68562
MALTQQLARVSPQYLAWCREAAAASPDGDPRWEPPESDTLDLDWAVWELLRLYRHAHPGAHEIAVLDRAIHGDADGRVGFLDHPTVHDGFDAPPAVLAPAAVREVARELSRVDIAPVLEAALPAYREAGGFSGFAGDPRACLVDHFTLLRRFYRAADERGMAVVVWAD